QPELEEIGEGESRLWRYRRGPEPDAPGPMTGRHHQAPIVPPPWLTASVPPESPAPAPLSPSRSYDEADASRIVTTRRENAGQAGARGVLIHRLLQLLPDVDTLLRESAARAYLARAGAAFGAVDHARFAAEALAVFADPRFAPLFAGGSRAEVPIVGRLA